MRRFYFDSFYYNTHHSLFVVVDRQRKSLEYQSWNHLSIPSMLDMQLYSGWDVVITEDTGGTDFGLDFWIEKLKSTMASREFGEGGLCFKGGRSATVPYRVPSRDCSLGARLAVKTPSSDELANLRLVLLILLAPFQFTALGIIVQPSWGSFSPFI